VRTADYSNGGPPEKVKLQQAVTDNTPASNAAPDDTPISAATPDEEYSQSTLPIYVPVIVLVVFTGFLLIYGTTRKAARRRAKDDNAVIAATGNQALDEILHSISKHISNLRKLEKAGQGKLQGPVQDIINTMEQIVQQLQRHSSGINQIRQFLNYTLPTTVTLLQSYDEFGRQPIQGKNIITAMEKIEGMMDTIVSSFHRQLDALFRDKALDVVMELEVMKNMLSEAGDITDIIYKNSDEAKQNQI